MKKTILIVALVLLALGALGVGVAFAQGQRTTFEFQGPRMQNGDGTLHTYLVAAFAEKLSLSVDDVNARLTAGESMYDIAIAEGVTAEEFPTLMTEVRSNALDGAVKANVISQEQADWMKSRGFGQGGMMNRGGYKGTCPMNGTGYDGQRGPGGMGGWQNP